MSRAVVSFECATCRKKAERYANATDRAGEVRRQFCSVDCRRVFDKRWHATMSRRQSDINRRRGAHE